jgi:hypothetical protein
MRPQVRDARIVATELIFPRFVYEHYGDVIDDRIHATARCTPQSILIFGQFDGLLAGGTDKYV